MPAGRIALWVASLGALALAVRSLLLRPVPLEIALLFGTAYVLLVVTGVLVPRLQMFGDIVWCGPTEAARVALTFDDGPDEHSTPLVLKQLAEASVRATFFVLGEKAMRSPDVVRAIVEGGHEIGVHGFRHDRLYAFLSPRKVANDIRRASDAVHTAAGVRPIWFRPPIGQASPRTFEGAKRAGVVVVGWSVRGLDGVASAVAGNVARRVTRRLSPGAIVLLHDAAEYGDRVPASIEALPEILKAIRERGLSAVSLSELIGDAERP